MDLLSLTIFGSFVWFCIFLAALIIAFFWSEGAEEGSIAFVAVVAFVLVNHFWGNIPLLRFVTWINVFAYLGVGFIYAVIRVYFYGRNTKSDDSSSYYTTRAINELKGNVFRWWFIWPISLIYWAISDLLGDLWNWIYQRFEGLFEYFFKLGQKSNKKV
jgi:hypothetical protein